MYSTLLLLAGIVVCVRMYVCGVAAAVLLTCSGGATLDDGRSNVPKHVAINLYNKTSS
jgi:hypothetical protein